MTPRQTASIDYHESILEGAPRRPLRCLYGAIDNGRTSVVGHDNRVAKDNAAQMSARGHKQSGGGQRRRKVEVARRAAGAYAPCAICPSCQSAASRSHCRLPQISGMSPRPASIRGALRDRHECWVRDAMDAAHQLTSDVARGRRSRVVLAPLGWCQACR